MADHIRKNLAAVRAHGPETIIPVNTFEGFSADFRTLLKVAERAVNSLDLFLGEPATYPDPKELAAEADPAGDLETSTK